MNIDQIVNFWNDIANQNRDKLKEYFVSEAKILWLNTNEQFSLDEFIIANCDYPGTWNAKISKIEKINDDELVTVTLITNLENAQSFYVVSFFYLVKGKIWKLEEYWGDCCDVSQWHKKLNLGKPIK